MMPGCRGILVLLACALSQICSQLCRLPCSCPWISAHCPPGSTRILDGCGCCNICSRRLGEPCDQINLCDQRQELTCDYSTSIDGRGGTCNYNQGDSCNINGKVYEDGETFQPSCKVQCTCVDGGVTCIPLCSEDVRLPSPTCPFPLRVEVPGKCCHEWICDQPQESKLLTSVEQGMVKFNCPEWSTEWGSCSTDCGIGISLRVTNQNSFCRLESQSRLCMVRPCGDFSASRTGAPCVPVVQSSHPVRLEFPGCISVHNFFPRFCGSCGLRKCVPHQTTTEMVEFKCKSGLFRKLMMMILSCVCY
ncbi:CCN family member 5 isoform X1 [Bufo gargarizans]|uniref:CCN family member 5 isoform X1 n=2 Tax=Bufo gargarizans TaxID=30331 RepID=UPI001CF3DBC8|nr:CCN family member 5 isoform X1 [Bufo gargarizans]